jgi:hypothetical protein
MTPQEIVETIQEIAGFAMLMGLTDSSQIETYDIAFSDKFGADIMQAFYRTLKRNNTIRNKIDQGLLSAKNEGIFVV